MSAVIEICTPVFGLALLGYLATRLGWFSTQAADGLVRFVFDWAVPFLLIRLFSTQVLPAEFPWRLLLSFYLPVFLLYGLALSMAALVFGLEPRSRVVAALGSTFGNSVLLGLPLMLLAFGEEGTVPFLVLISVHSISLFTLSAVLLEYARQRETGQGKLYKNILMGLSSNPILLGIATGLALNHFGIGLPGPLDRITAYMQQSVAACSLFALGACLTRYKVAGRLAETCSVVVLKNLLLPFLVWFMAYAVFQLRPVEMVAAVMLAALPSGINVYLFAERYGSGQRLATTTIFLSTAVSLFTLAAALVWARKVVG